MSSFLPITSHPQFRPDLDRIASEAAVARAKVPVFRRSSVPGHYVLTFFCPKRKMIIHSLLRAEGSSHILNVAENGFVYARYGSPQELLEDVLGPDTDPCH
jgi:hypothetical protein